MYWVIRKVPRIAFYFTQSATTGFIASVFPSRSRVSFKKAFAGPELCDWKLSHPVLRGLDGSNPVRLLGKLSSPVLRGLSGRKAARLPGEANRRDGLGRLGPQSSLSSSRQGVTQWYPRLRTMLHGEGSDSSPSGCRFCRSPGDFSLPRCHQPGRLGRGGATNEVISMLVLSRTFRTPRIRKDRDADDTQAVDLHFQRGFESQILANLSSKKIHVREKRCTRPRPAM